MKLIYKSLIYFFFWPFLLVYMGFKWLYNRKSVSSVVYNIHAVDHLSGEDFEWYLHALFTDLGYQVNTTAISGDYGVDLILKGNNHTTIIQAKRYSGNVGVSAIQEIVAAKNLYLASNCAVVTNSYFTKNAQILAQSNRVDLIDRSSLIELMVRANMTNNSRVRNSRNTDNPITKNEDSSYVKIVDDPLLQSAINEVLKANQASVSLLQRKLRLGYVESSRLIDKMEELGIVGPYNGSNPRKVYPPKQ